MWCNCVYIVCGSVCVNRRILISASNLEIRSYKHVALAASEAVITRSGATLHHLYESAHLQTQHSRHVRLTFTITVTHNAMLPCGWIGPNSPLLRMVSYPIVV